MIKKEIPIEGIDDDIIDKILTEGIQCCANVEVGEVVSCLMTMFQHIQNTKMVKDAKQNLNKEQCKAIDQLLISVFVSEVATLTANFKRREEKGADA